MISVEEAKNKIAGATRVLPPVQVSLMRAAGKILAEDVFAISDVPSFPQSAMDGYAFSFDDWKGGGELKIIGELQAGAEAELSIDNGEAARVFTGAPLPAGADTVVMQEKVTLSQSGILIEDDGLRKSNNVRPAGSEIKKGELALEAGSLLTPAGVGLLAGIGVDSVSVYPDPKISLIITGKELQKPGNPLQYGQVYESNSFTLAAALSGAGIDDVVILYADDNLQGLTNILQQALETSDVVLLTGGVSVGDYDFVVKAASACNVEKIFHKVKQRPGKPLFFGTRDARLVFGLPGNPSSVLTCFYQYVLPALGQLTGRPLQLQRESSVLNTAYKKVHQLTHFLKGFYNGSTVDILEAQESYRLRYFAKANCLIELGEAAKDYQPGEAVFFYKLPV